MKLLLISPPFKCLTGLYSYGFPLGLCILASIAKEEGFEACVFEADKIMPVEDLNLSDEHATLDKYTASVNDAAHPAWQELKRVVSSFKPDIVGITAYTTTFASALRSAEICKSCDNNITTVLGGPHPTACPQDCFKSKAIDFIVLGEGEAPLRHLLRYIQQREGSINAIPSLGYRQDGRIVINPQADFIKDLDSLSLPDRESLFCRDRYSFADMGLLLASRGCPFNCTYCFHFWGKSVRYRSSDNVIKEIIAVRDNYGTNHFVFKDDMMTLNKGWMREFCAKLKDGHLKITWECTTRADLLDAPLLDTMISSGCTVVKIGVESGSEDILQRTQKGIDKDTLTKAAALLNSRKVFWSGYFMYGLPFETEQDLLETRKFMQALRPDYAALCLFHVAPLTQIYEYGVRAGIYYKEVLLEHFFRVNPKDYYIINPARRSLYIEPERFKALESFLVGEFDNYNTSLIKLLKRGWMRRSIYLKKIPFLFKEAKMGLRWLVKNRFKRIKASKWSL